MTVLRTCRSDHADKLPPSTGEPNLVFLVPSQQVAQVTVALLNKQVRRLVRCFAEENAAICFPRCLPDKEARLHSSCHVKYTAGIYPTNTLW